MAGVKAVKAGWYNAFRPWTLHGAIIPVLLGAAFAFAAGSREWFLFILALAGGILLQSAANLLNTYGDFETGLDTEENHTRSPELVTGKLRPKDVFRMGMACIGITALLGLVMIWQTGWGILWFGIAGIIGAGTYTVGISYKYLGLGQVSVFLMMGLLMPLGTYYLMTGLFSWELLLVSLPNAFMITAVLCGNELRDFDSDYEAGVRTLAGRMGYDPAMKMYMFMNTVPFVIAPVLILAGLLPWTCLLIFIALYQWNITRTNAAKAKGNKKESFMLVPLAFKQNWVFGLLLVIGYLLGLYI